MAITFTWSIPQNGLLVQTVDGVPDVVTNVRYTITATDGINTVSQAGSQRVSLDQTQTFIPFNELTEEQAITWVKQQLPTNAIASIEKNLTRRLDNLANPPERPVTKPLPW